MKRKIEIESSAGHEEKDSLEIESSAGHEEKDSLEIESSAGHEEKDSLEIESSAGPASSGCTCTCAICSNFITCQFYWTFYLNILLFCRIWAQLDRWRAERYDRTQGSHVEVDAQSAEDTRTAGRSNERRGQRCCSSTVWEPQTICYSWERRLRHSFHISGEGHTDMYHSFHV